MVTMLCNILVSGFCTAVVLSAAGLPFFASITGGFAMVNGLWAIVMAIRVRG